MFQLPALTTASVLIKLLYIRVLKINNNNNNNNNRHMYTAPYMPTEGHRGAENC